MALVTNTCGHPHCWEPMCTDVDWMCPHFKPRLFGFIPLPRRLGDWIMMKEEIRFLKNYYKTHKKEYNIMEDDFCE